jgi:hypothetical protein
LRFVERGDDAWLDAGFARVMSNASLGVGSARHPVARTNVCNVPRSPKKIELERFVVRRKERAARSAG